MSYLRIALASMLIPFLFSLPAAAEKRVALGRRQLGLQGGVAAAQPRQRCQRHRGVAESARASTSSLGVDVDKRDFDSRIRSFTQLLETRRRRAPLLCRPRAAGRRPQLSHPGRRQAAERARARLRRREPRLHPEADGARPRRQDQHRLPRRLPRQSVLRQPRALDGDALGEHRQGPRAGGDRRRHVHRLFDPARQRRRRGAGRNSPFTAALSKYIKESNHNLRR